MCVICETKDPRDLSTLTALNCSYCTALTSLPNNLTSLQKLYCWGCTSLTSLPNNLTSLKELDCDGLPKIAMALTLQRYLSHLTKAKAKQSGQGGSRNQLTPLKQMKCHQVRNDVSISRVQHRLEWNNFSRPTT